MLKAYPLEVPNYHYISSDIDGLRLCPDCVYPGH